MRISKKDIVAVGVVLLGCMGLASVIVLDKRYLGNGILEEGWPDLSLDHILRSIEIFTFVLVVFYGLIYKRKPKLIIDESKWTPFEQISILIALTVSVVFLFLFIFAPSSFSSLSLEDGPIEWGVRLIAF